jgi:hypothetical protein
VKRLDEEQRDAQLRQRDRKERHRLAQKLLHFRRQKRLVQKSLRKESYADIFTFYASRTQQGKQKRRRSATLQFPRVFSFIDAPDEAIRTVESFVAKVRSRPGQIGINQTRCEQIDVCAEGVLIALALAAKRKHKILYAGSFPEKPEVFEIVQATGITYALGISRDRSNRFLVHPLVQGRTSPGKSRESSVCELETTRLVEYINECLKRYGKILTSEAVGRFTDMIAEVVNNCEDHSGRAEWWLSAYMRQPEAAAYGDVHITIFNFGDTIADTMQRLPSDSEIRGDIEGLIRKLERERVFLKGAYSVENVWTLCSLQAGVSSKNPQPEELGHRGGGTVKLIEAFLRLGRVDGVDVRPKMALVSGRTHITFDGSYSFREVPTNAGEMRKTITFNSTHDLGEPPDPASVQILREYFPGTLLSFRFFLQQKHLDTVPDYAADHRP